MFFFSAFFLPKAFAVDTIPLQFFTYTHMKIPEQDVFIESKDNPGDVVRVESEDAVQPDILKSMVYTVKERIEHDLFTTSDFPLGPFPRGKSLGFTLEQWLSASGSGTYAIGEDKVSLSLSFQNLVPRGVYTVWCSRWSLPPNASIIDRPCITKDENHAFTADAAGNGTLYIPLSSPLEKSEKETLTALTLAYHGDGKAPAALLGDFGINTHVQLLSFLPSQEVLPTPTESEKVISARTGFIALAFLMIGGLVIVWWCVKRRMERENFTP